MQRLLPYVFLPCLTLFLLPSITLGLAGLSEQDYEYNYSPKILIDFNVPSDFCPRDYNSHQDCILLYGATEDYGPNQYTPDLDRFSAVNIPQTTEPRYVIGKSYFDSTWLIYDLKGRKLVFRDPSYAKVESQWLALGNSEPEFVDTETFPKYFHNETERSRRDHADLEAFANSILLWIGVLLLIGCVIAAGLVFLLNKLFPGGDRGKS